MVRLDDLSQVGEAVRELNPGIFRWEADEKKKKPRKYKNVRTFAVDRTFASGREEVRAGELNLLLRAGEIFCLNFQVRFPLPGKTVYIADFVYLDKQLEPVIEDAKGIKTPVYKLKKRQFAERYGKEIEEV